MSAVSEGRHETPMKKKRRTHSPEFKARVAMEALKGIKPVHPIASKNEIHQVQVSQWKKERKRPEPPRAPSGGPGAHVGSPSLRSRRREFLPHAQV